MKNSYMVWWIWHCFSISANVFHVWLYRRQLDPPIWFCTSICCDVVWVEVYEENPVSYRCVVRKRRCFSVTFLGDLNILWNYKKHSLKGHFLKVSCTVRSKSTFNTMLWSLWKYCFTELCKFSKYSDFYYAISKSHIC